MQYYYNFIRIDSVTWFIIWNYSLNNARLTPQGLTNVELINSSSSSQLSIFTQDYAALFSNFVPYEAHGVKISNVNKRT